MEKPLHSWYGAVCFVLLTALLVAQTLWFVCDSEVIPSTEPRTGYFMFLDHRAMFSSLELWCHSAGTFSLVPSFPPRSLCLKSFPLVSCVLDLCLCCFQVRFFALFSLLFFLLICGCFGNLSSVYQFRS